MNREWKLLLGRVLVVKVLIVDVEEEVAVDRNVRFDSQFHVSYSED